MFISSNLIIMVKSSRMSWAGHVVRMGAKRHVYRVSVGQPEREIPVGRYRHRWEANIKMDVTDIGWGGVE
jgi:hypothetical protein